jgi:hypothetical protein
MIKYYLSEDPSFKVTAVDFNNCDAAYCGFIEIIGNTRVLESNGGNFFNRNVNRVELTNRGTVGFHYYFTTDSI